MGTSEPNGKRVDALCARMAASAWPKGTGNVPAGLVWILTLVISSGHSATSAMTSALAEPASHIAPLYFADVSSPAIFMYWSLKISYNPYLKSPWSE